MLRVPLIVSFVLVVAVVVLKADERPLFDLDREMSAKEQAATGVDQLTAEQRAALTAWFRTYLGQKEAETMAAEVERKEKVFGFVSQPQKVKEIIEEVEVESIETRIRGEFRGWTGRTLFYLENGQVWQQRLSGRYADKMDNPRVRIVRRKGYYWLELVDRRARVGVKRVR